MLKVSVLQGDLVTYFVVLLPIFVLDLTPCPGCYVIHWRKIGEHINLRRGGGSSSSQTESCLKGDADLFGRIDQRRKVS